MRRFLLFALLLALANLIRAQETPDGFYYQKYITFMTVHEDNSYSIREVMTPYFVEPRHGIYRSIPNSIWIKRDTTESQNRTGSIVRHYDVDIDINGCNMPYQVESAEGLKDIRIGSANRYLEGENTITLDYEMRLPDDRTPQADLFFHSVLGTGNPCTVQQMAFRIYFDTPLPPESLNKIEIFKGAEGNQANYAQEVLVECTPDSITGWINGLAPYEGVSVYIPLPEGYFCAPQSPNILWSKILAVIACIILIYVIYKEIFRDNHITKVVTFYPPEQVSSAEVGTLFDCSADDQDLISLIPWFANFGYLRIYQNDEGKLMLKRLKDLPDDAPLHQRMIFEALFPGGSYDFDTTAQTSINFGKMWLKAKEKLQSENRRHFDQFELSTFGWLLLALLCGAIAAALADTTPDANFRGATAFFCYLVEIIAITFFVGGPDHKGCSLSIIGAFILLFVYNAPLSQLPEDLFIPRAYLQAFDILAFSACLFTYRLTIMTEYRRNRMGEILGLQEFIRTADVERLKALLTADGRYFYKVLPYAIAFGLADRWAAQFANLTIPPADEISAMPQDLNTISHFLDNSNIRHGIEAEKKRQAEAEARAREEAARHRASSGSSYHSSSSHSSGGGGYSGGGSGGGGSRSW